MKERFDKVKRLLSEKFTLYPVLTGILFLVNELRKNFVFFTVKESVSLILIVLAFTILIDFLSRKLVKNKIKAALIAVLFVFINLFYLDIFQILSSQKFLIEFINSTTSDHPEVIIIPILFFFWLTISYFILRTKRSLESLNLYLNVLIIAFVLFEAIQCFIAPVPQIILAKNKPLPVNADLKQEQKPDIYYIILDAYTSSESLKKYWKYDNSKFEDSLKQLGFNIAAHSKTDLTHTPYCLASYLNSSSLILDTKQHYNERNLLQLIRNNRLSDWLRANNYLCFNYSCFDSFGNNKYYKFFTYNHFLGRTIWYTNFYKLYHFLNPSSLVSRTNLEIFSKLNHLTEERHNKPIFTYAHVMMPHFPYYYNEYGKPYNKSDSLSDKQKYLGQLIYTNSLTLESINDILASSPGKPIIIIQGDHGFRYLADTTLIEKSFETHTIFYASYAPNGIVIPDTINPANTFEELIQEINH